MSEINQFPLLTKEEEFHLGKLITKGQLAKKKLDSNEVNDLDIKQLKDQIHQGLIARNKLVESNFRLVVSRANSYSNSDVPLLDLIQEGNRGLMQAADGYDYTKGFRFSTYAVPWIDQALKRGYDNLGPTISVPTYVKDLKRKIDRFILQIVQETGEAPSVETIIKSLDIAKDYYNRAMDIPYQISLNKIIDEQNKSTIEDLVEDETSLTPEEYYLQEVTIDYIEQLLTKLDETEKFIIERRFGLFGNPVHTLRQLAETLNLTAERIRQIENTAKNKLKN